MASRLNEVSLKMHWGTIVGDSREDLREAFEQASKRADIVIVNGGLGPTVDDLSQEIAAEAAGVKLKLNQAWLDRMLTFYRDEVGPCLQTIKNKRYSRKARNLLIIQ